MLRRPRLGIQCDTADRSLDQCRHSIPKLKCKYCHLRRTTIRVATRKITGSRLSYIRDDRRPNILDCVESPYIRSPNRLGCTFRAILPSSLRLGNGDGTTEDRHVWVQYNCMIQAQMAEDLGGSLQDVYFLVGSLLSRRGILNSRLAECLGTL